VDPRAGLDDLEKRIYLTISGLELRPSVVQPVARRYTDYALPAPIKNGSNGKYLPAGNRSNYLLGAESFLRNYQLFIYTRISENFVEPKY
jgi:hypothetical protein